MRTRTIAAVFMGCAFVLFAMGCSQQRPGAKAQKIQQHNLQKQFP
jgi:hypothetical protein